MLNFRKMIFAILILLIIFIIGFSISKTVNGEEIVILNDDKTSTMILKSSDVINRIVPEPTEETIVEPEVIVTPESTPEPIVSSYKLYDVKITYYCSEHYDHICNNGHYDSTATGSTPTVGRTIAVDPNKIPLGSTVIIDGHSYVAEDTGGAINGNKIDILVATHAEALQNGVKYVDYVEVIE